MLRMEKIVFSKKSNANSYPVPNGQSQKHIYKSQYIDWASYV